MKTYRSQKGLIEAWIVGARDGVKSGGYGMLRFCGPILYWAKYKNSIARVINYNSHSSGEEIILFRDPNTDISTSIYKDIRKHLEERYDPLMINVSWNVLHGNLREDVIPYMMNERAEAIENAIESDPYTYEEVDDTYHMIIKANLLAENISRYSEAVLNKILEVAMIPTNTAPDRIGYLIAKDAASRMRDSVSE